MINLSTGLPGAGKTLFTIAFVKALAEKEHRPVFYSGISELALDWHEIDADKWTECPSGSIIVIDECQRIFRPRGAGSKVPEYVSALETHRHKGLDLFLITQHPMLMDANVRRLTERHWHICRRFGMQRATIFRYESCKDQPLANTASGQRMDWKYPKEVYDWYKSAEVHTVKRRLPKSFYTVLVILLALAGILVFLYDRYYTDGQLTLTQSERERVKAMEKNESSGTAAAPAPSTPRSEPGAADKKPMTPAEYIESYTPRIEGLAYTAPAYDEVTQPEEAPVPVACIVNQSKGCQCYSQQATRLAMEDRLCRDIVENGFFRAFSIKSDRAALAPQRFTENPATAPKTASASPSALIIPPQTPMELTPYVPLSSGRGASASPKLNPSLRGG